MIGQRTPAVDESFPFINYTFTPRRSPWKDNSTTSFRLATSKPLFQSRQRPPRGGRKEKVSVNDDVVFLAHSAEEDYIIID
jgi:hypothetical protein